MQFFYSKKSSRKVFHYSHCPHYLHMDHNDMGTFDSLEEAQAAGYHVCRYCAPMGKYYRRERKGLETYAVQNGLIFEYNDGAIDIQSPYSEWKLICAGKSHALILYHKNTQQRKNDHSLIPGYHSQAFRAKTILDYMVFILQHDCYRNIHPEYHKPAPTPPPRKGTHRYKKQSRKQKARERAASIQRVYHMIDYERNRSRLVAERAKQFACVP